jgi:hypothetical protein
MAVRQDRGKIRRKTATLPFSTASVDLKRQASKTSRWREGPDPMTTLLKIMLDANAPAASRLRAADTVLAHAIKAMELEDVEVRVAELERLAAAAKENGNGRV